MHLTDLNTAPPGGWRFQEERTGFWATGVTFNSMVNSVAQHRQNMKFQIVSPGYETLAAEIQNWICQHLSEQDRERLCATPNKVIGPHPGDVLSLLIHKVTGRYASTCGVCVGRMKMMNDKGWWWCWKNRALILSWLTDEASKRGHAIEDSHAKTLFRAAFAEMFAHRKNTEGQ
jgi:hypothetical protein